MSDEFEIKLAEPFFVPLDLAQLYDEAVKEFGKVLSKHLEAVQGHDRLPRSIAAEIKTAILDYLKEEVYDEEDLADIITKKLHEAGVPEASQVAEKAVSEWLEKLKKLLKKLIKKKGGE